MRSHLILLLLWFCFRNVGYAQVSQIQFRLHQRVQLAYSGAQAPAVKKIQYHNLKGRKFISFHDEEKYSLFIYELNDSFRTIHIDSLSIITPYRQGYQNLIGYNILSLDSIILAFNPFYRENYIHDTCIIMVDIHGNLKGVASFKGIHVPSRSALSSGKYIGYLGDFDTLNLYYNYLNFFGASCLNLNDQNELLIGLAPFGSVRRTCDHVPVESSYQAAFLSFDTLKEARKLHQIYFPCNGNKYYYPFSMTWPRMAYNSVAHAFVFGFGINNRISVMKSDGDFEYLKLRSYLLDSVKPYKQFYDEFYDYNRSQFEELAFNNKTGELYRNLRLGLAFVEGDTPIYQDKYLKDAVNILQVYDSSYHLKGEGILPENHSCIYIPFEKGILIYREDESNRQNSIIFDYMEFEYKATSLQNYRKLVNAAVSIQKKKSDLSNYINYLAQIFPNRNFKHVFIFNHANTTTDAKAFWNQYFISHLKNLESDSIAFVFISNTELKDSVKAYLPMKNVCFDFSGTYKQFIGPVSFAQYTNLDNLNFMVETNDPSHSYRIVNRLRDWFLLGETTWH